MSRTVHYAGLIFLGLAFLLANSGKLSADDRQQTPETATQESPSFHFGGGGTEVDGAAQERIVEKSATKFSLPEQMSDRLKRALENHPDVAAAKAKLQLAEAELNQVRMEIAQNVIHQHLEIIAQEMNVKAMQETIQSGRNLPQEHQIRERAKLAELQSTLDVLLGQYNVGTASGSDDRDGDADPMLNSISTTNDQGGNKVFSKRLPNEKLRRKLAIALFEPTEVAFADTPLSEAIEYLAEQHGLNLTFDHNGLANSGIELDSIEISSVLDGIMLKSALDLIGDPHDIRFVVADYGLLVTVQGSPMDEKYVSVADADDWLSQELIDQKLRQNDDPLFNKGLPDEKMQKLLAVALQKTVNINYSDGMTLRDAVRSLFAQCEVPVFFDVNRSSAGVDSVVPSLTVAGLTLKSALKLFKDLGNHTYFAVTDFGIFVTSPESTMAKKYVELEDADEWMKAQFLGPKTGESEEKKVTVDEDQESESSSEAN